MSAVSVPPAATSKTCCAVTTATAYRITVEDVQAALAYAAELAKERVFTLPGEVA